MSYNLSGCVFIRNNFEGAFCLFESVHQLLPLCDEFIIMDLGSDDGTLEVLQEIYDTNPKVRLVHSNFYKQDASIFADLANDLIAMCACDNVLYYQSDEIWHENLVNLTREFLENGERNLSFWRVQLKYNFQRIKWFPHPVHRIAPKNEFKFVGDGMNTSKTFSSVICSSWNMGYFTQWGDKYKNAPEMLPLGDMILDVSLTGGFLENIPQRRRMHLPFWHEGDVMPADEGGLAIDEWIRQQRQNDDWKKTKTDFYIPEIMRYHVGKSRYELRPKLLESLKRYDEWR